MPTMDLPSAKPATRSNTQAMLRLTHEEVRVLQYYRHLSATDRVATRCLLQVLQPARHTKKARSGTAGQA